MTNSLFEEENKQVIQTFVNNEEKPSMTIEDLVGEGKKYADQDAANNALIAAQLHIANLERERAADRETLAKQTAVEDIYAKIEQKLSSAPVVAPELNPVIQTPTSDDLQKPAANVGLTSDDVEALLAKREQEATSTSNLSKVKADLQLKYGDATQAVLRDVSVKTGWSEQQLNDMAATNPTGLIALVEGVKKPTAAPAPNPLVSDVNSTVMSNINQQAANPAETRKDYWLGVQDENKKRGIIGLDADQTMARDKEVQQLGAAFFGR